MPFNPNKPFTVRSEPQVREVPLRGGIGEFVTPERAAQIAALRQPMRETPFTGAFPQESQLGAAISRGLLSGVSGEFLPALTERTGLVERFDTAEPQFTDPLTFGIAEAIGGALPIGRGAKAVQATVGQARRLIPQIISAIRAAAPVALPTGFAAGAAEPLRTGAGALETTTKGGVGSAISLALSGAPPAAARALEKGGTALKNYFSKDPLAYSRAAERLFYDTVGEITNPLTAQRVGNFIDEGNLQLSVSDIKRMGRLPSSLRESIPAVKKSQNPLFEEAKSFAQKHSKYKIKNVFEGLGEELSQTRRIEEVLDPQGIGSLRNVVKKLQGDIDFPDSLEIQKELNLLSKKVLNKKELDIKTAEADPDYALIQSMRKRLSGAINDAFTGISGKEDNPYRRYGALVQLEEFLENRFDRLRSVQPKGVAGRIRERGFIQGILPAEDEMKIADNAITDLFDITPEFKAAPLLSQVRQSRLSRSVKTPQQVEAEAIAAQKARTAAGARELREAERMKKAQRRAAEASAIPPPISP